MNRPGGILHRDQGPEIYGEDSSPPVDFMYLFSVFRLHLSTILAVTGLAGAAMLVHVMTVDPIYSADAQIVLDTREERVSPAEDVVSNLDISNSVVAGEVVTMQSNVLLGQVVDKLDLLNEPAFDPRVARPEPLFERLKRFARRGDPSHVIAGRLPEETLRSWVIGTVRQNLEVSQFGVSYAIGIRYEDTNPVMAARVANAVAEQYIASQLESKLDATARASAWLSDRLQELSVQVEEADAAVVIFQAEMIDSAQGSEDSINQLLAELNTRLVASSTDRADAEVRLGQVEALLSAGGVRAVGDVVTSPLLETLTRQRAELASNQAQLASTLGRRHPEMIRIAAQLADIQASIDTELERRIEEMRGDVTVTRNRENALQRQIETVSDRADSLSRASVRLAQLERSAQATRLVYENFLARHKETAAQADFQTPEARIIGRAEVPVVPAKPRKTLMMLAAIVLGFSGAVVFVFLRNLVRSPISTVRQLRALTHRPNLAELPYVPHFGTNFRWLQRELSDAPRTTYAERVKSMRASLLDASRSRGPKIIMVTSSVPNEGKTALCGVLAKVLTQSKKSALLIDADLRQPDIRAALGLPQNGQCLIDYLENEGNLKDLVQHSDTFGVSVISASKRCEYAADLLSGPRFEGLLKRMSSKYGVIVLNAPPVMYMADAVVLAERADATVFTVRCGRTPVNTVRNALHRLDAAGANVEGTVLSMVRRADSAAKETHMHAYGY